MKKYLLSLAMLCAAGVVSAQSTIIESLQIDRLGEGKVVVHQDAAITNLLGLRFISSPLTESQRTLKGSAAAKRS